MSLTSGPHWSGLTLTATVDLLRSAWRNADAIIGFTGFILTQEIPENSANFYKSYKINRNSKWNKLYMKNDQKNPIYPSVPFSCMFDQLISAIYNNLNKWHLKCLMWSLNLNLGFKPTSFNLLLVALAQTTAYCHVMIMHHIVHCIDWISSLLPVFVPSR